MGELGRENRGIMEVEGIEGEDEGCKDREACKEANQGRLGTRGMNTEEM